MGKTISKLMESPIQLVTIQFHRVASTPELATNFIDYKQMAGMTTV